MRSWPLLALVTGASLLLSGCTLVVDGQTDRQAGTVTIGPDTPDDLRPDEQDAVQVTASFWRTAFPEEFGSGYTAGRGGGYIGGRPANVGGQTSVPFNALYCARRTS